MAHNKVGLFSQASSSTQLTAQKITRSASARPRHDDHKQAPSQRQLKSTKPVCHDDSKEEYTSSALPSKYASQFSPEIWEAMQEAVRATCPLPLPPSAPSNLSPKVEEPLSSELSIERLNRRSSQDRKFTTYSIGGLQVQLEHLLLEPGEIGALNLAASIRNLSLFRVFFSDEQFSALIESLPLLETVSIQWCPSLSNAVLKDLVLLKCLKSFTLFCCPNVTEKGLTSLLAQKPWQDLEILDLSGTGVSDEALESVAPLEKLKMLRLSSCEWVSQKGLFLFDRHASLERIAVSGCLLGQIDVDTFKIRNPKIEVEFQVEYDQSAELSALALKEARFLIDSDAFFDLVHLSSFLTQEKVEHSRPLTLKNLPKLSDETQVRIADLYAIELQRRLLMIGDDPLEWHEIDLMIQASDNLSNLTAAIVTAFRKVGYFIVGREDVQIPHNALELLQQMKDSPEMQRKVSQLKFEELGLTFIPRCIYMQQWPALKELLLGGNRLLEIPPQFFVFAPNLAYFSCPHNQIYVIADDLGSYWSPVAIDLNFNNIMEVPKDFGLGNAALEMVLMKNNLVGEVPQTFIDRLGSMPQFKSWDLQGNPTRGKPKDPRIIY